MATRSWKFSKKKLFLFLSALLIVIAGCVGGISAIALSTRSDSTSFESEQIRELEEILAHTTDPEMRKVLEEKITMLQSESIDEAIAISTSVEKPDDPCAQRPPISSSPDSERRIGIFEGPSPFRSTDIVVINQWQDKVNGFWTHVYAGSLFGNEKQGIIVVSVEGMNLGGRYLTPDQVGAVKIVSVTGYRLELAAENGKVFYFDVPAQAFASSPVEAIPPLIPAPTYTPTVSPCLEFPLAGDNTPYP